MMRHNELGFGVGKSICLTRSITRQVAESPKDWDFFFTGACMKVFIQNSRGNIKHTSIVFFFCINLFYVRLCTRLNNVIYVTKCHACAMLANDECLVLHYQFRLSCRNALHVRYKETL